MDLGDCGLQSPEALVYMACVRLQQPSLLLERLSARASRPFQALCVST